MQVQPTVVHQNGIVTVTMKAAFVGDVTDVTDQQRVAAYGDPQVNLAGTFTDPNDPNFKFTFPASQVYVGITTQMQNYPVRFMTAVPQMGPVPGNWNPFAPVDPFRPRNNWDTTGTSTPQIQQGSLDCVVSDPVRAATIWAAALDSAVQTAMVTLRAKTPAQLTSLPNATV